MKINLLLGTRDWIALHIPTTVGVLIFLIATIQMASVLTCSPSALTELP